MQTFLPHPNFTVSAMQIDYRRLGKQRVEARQIQTAIQQCREFHNEQNPVSEQDWRNMAAGFSEDVRTREGRRPGWVTHAATMMWVNNVKALMLYGDVCIREWVRRGYRNTMPLMLTAEHDGDIPMDIQMPDWLGDESVHASHRSNLLRKDPEFYAQFDWNEGPDLEYEWPFSLGVQT